MADLTLRKLEREASTGGDDAKERLQRYRCRIDLHGEGESDYRRMMAVSTAVDSDMKLLSVSVVSPVVYLECVHCRARWASSIMREPVQAAMERLMGVRELAIIDAVIRTGGAEGDMATIKATGASWEPKTVRQLSAERSRGAFRRAGRDR